MKFTVQNNAQGKQKGEKTCAKIINTYKSMKRP